MTEKIRDIITREQKEADKKKELAKRLGRISVEKGPKKTYDKDSVDAIVKKMRSRFEDKGFTEEKESSKATELKEMVEGKKASDYDQRLPAELVSSDKTLLQLVGKIYTKLGFLNKVVDRVFNYGFAKTLPDDLDAANMNFSPKQFIGIAVIAAFLTGFFAFFFTFALLFTALSSVVESTLPGMNSILYLIIDLFASGVTAFFALAFGLIFFVKWPSSSKSYRAKDIDKNLPFALRHMATEIKAGVGIHKTMESIVEAGYGEISVEFERTLKDIDKGVNTEDALLALGHRSPSENLRRATMHMVRAIKSGGSLSGIISQIASDVSFDLRMKMRDFIERLNIIGLFYMMLGIVFPVFIAVLAGIFNAVPTIGMAGVLGVQVIFLIYFLLIPMGLGLILYVIKVMQPM